jgi:hypothetical protein
MVAFTIKLKLKFKLNYDRRSVIQCLGVGLPYGAHDQSFLFDNCVSCCGAPSLTRGWICNLLVQLTLGLARAITLGSRLELRPYFTVSFETFSTWRARSPYLYLPGTGWPNYTPRHCVPFSSPLTARKDKVEVF